MCAADAPQLMSLFLVFCTQLCSPSVQFPLPIFSSSYLVYISLAIALEMVNVCIHVLMYVCCTAV